MDMSLCKVQDVMKDREAWHVAVHGVAKSRTRLATEEQCVNMCIGEEPKARS